MNVQKFISILFLLNFISLSGQDYKERLKALEDKASIHFYSNKDSTYFYYNEMYQLALKQADYITLIDNLNYVCFAAGYYYDTDKIKSTIETIDYHIQKNSSVLDTLPNLGDNQINYLNYNKGNYYHKVGDYPQAQIYFEKIIDNLTKTIVNLPIQQLICKACLLSKRLQINYL